MRLSLSQQIEDAASKRQELWLGRESGPEVRILTARLEELYEARRAEDARSRSSADRTEIVRRARVETELERLMG